MKENEMNKTLSGLYGGFLATGPMTFGMMEIQRRLSNAEKYSLPPATFSFRMLTRVVPNYEPSEAIQAALTLVAHFSYGSLMGATYAWKFSDLKMSPLLKGTAFGVVVWAGRYLVLSPSLKPRAQAPNMPSSRNWMMFVNHLVWGMALGYAEAQFRQIETARVVRA